MTLFKVLSNTQSSVAHTPGHQANRDVPQARCTACENIPDGLNKFCNWFADPVAGKGLSRLFREMEDWQ